MPRKKADDMRRTTLFMPKAMLDRLAKASDESGAPVSELIRRAVDAWLSEKGY